MKNWIKLVAILLTFVLLLPTVIACQKEEESHNTTGVTTTPANPGEVTPDSDDCKKHTPSKSGMY